MTQQISAGDQTFTLAGAPPSTLGARCSSSRGWTMMVIIMTGMDRKKIQ